MEKAILKTLIYADIFDYSLKPYEIHKWLIGRKASLRQVESAIGRLVESKKLKVKKGYYFLPRREGTVLKRQRRHKQSVNYLRKAKLLTYILKIIPWVKLVGISGGLAMSNAKKGDDIDLILITSKNRLWLSRILVLILLSITGQRRKVGENGRKVAGKLCINILLEEDNLAQTNKDIYVAHEVLQMIPIWYKDGIYSKYLGDNEWVFKFLPNWTTSSLRGVETTKQSKTEIATPFGLAMTGVERIAKWLQLRIMQKPKGMERIQDGALYFHPKDCRPKILAQYKKRVSKT